MSTRYGPVGVTVAMLNEFNKLCEGLSREGSTMRYGKEFYRGRVGGGAREVVVAYSNCGKVNAALAASTLIHDYDVTHIVHIGLAGALDGQLRPYDVVVARELAYHDFDATSFGAAYSPRGTIPQDKKRIFGADDALARLAERSATAVAKNAQLDARSQVYCGMVVSGDQFIGSPGACEDILGDDCFPTALCCDMESAAVAHACTLAGIPFAAVLTIANNADGSTHSDFTRNESKYVGHAIMVATEMLEKMCAGDAAE